MNEKQAIEIMLFGANGTNSTTQWTPPTGFTEMSEVAYNTPANSGQTSYINNGNGASTLSWTNANTTPWGTVGIEFIAYVPFDPMGRMGFFGI